jgi:hypothetical protein
VRGEYRKTISFNLIFVGLDIEIVPRNALWMTCCGISFKKLEKRVDLFLNALLSFYSPFRVFLICCGKTHGSFLVNTYSCLAKVTQHSECLLWPPLVPSLLFVNVYGKSLFQVCQEVMWFPLRLRPKASLSHLL